MVNYSAPKVGNNVKGALASSVSPGDNHFTLVEGQGARFPSVVETQTATEKQSYFFVVISSAANPNNTQIYKVNDRFNDRCNITTAGAPANNGHTFSAGDPVELRLNANFLDDTFDIDNLVPSDELFIPVPVNRKTWRFQQPALDDISLSGSKLYRGAPKYIGGKTDLFGGFPPDRYRLFRGTNSFFSFGYEVDTTPDTVEELGPLTAIRDNISATSTGINIRIGFLVENREPAFIYQSNGTNVELKFSNPDNISNIVNTSTGYLALPVRSHPYIISVHQAETGVWTTDIKEGLTAHYNNNTLRLDYSENSAANPLTPGQGLFDARFGTSRYGKLARYPNIYFDDGHASGQLSARYKYTNDTLGNVNGGDTEFAINGYTYAFKSLIDGGESETSILNANNPTELPVKNTRGSDTFINNEAHDIIIPHGSIVYLGNTGGTTRVSFINNTTGAGTHGKYNGNTNVEPYADIPNSYGGWLHTFQNVSNACGIFMYYENEGALGDGFLAINGGTNSGNYIDIRRFQRILSPLSSGSQQQGSSTIVSHVDANNPKFGVTTFGATSFATGNDPNRNANNFSKGQQTSLKRFNQLHTSGGSGNDNFWSVPLNSQGNLFHHLLGLEILPISPWRYNTANTILDIPFGTYISKVEVRQADNGAAGPGGDTTQVGSGTLAANHEKRSFKLHFSNGIKFPATGVPMTFYRSRRNQLGKEYSAAWHDGPYYKRETSAPTTVSMNGWTDNEKNVKHDAYMPIAGQIANVYFVTDQNQANNNRSTTPLEGNGYRETTQRTVTMGQEETGGFGAPYTVQRVKCKPTHENSVFEVSFGGTARAVSAGYLGIQLHMDVYTNDPQPNNTRIFKGTFNDTNIKASFIVANYMHNDGYYPVELLNASTLFDEKCTEDDVPTEFNSHVHNVQGVQTAKLQPFRAEFANGRMTAAAEPNHNTANNQNYAIGADVYLHGNKNNGNPYNGGTAQYPLGFADDLPYYQGEPAHTITGSSASVFIRPGVTDPIAFRLTLYHINTSNGNTSFKSSILPTTGSGFHLLVEEHTQPENKFGFNIEGGLDTTAQWQGYNF